MTDNLERALQERLLARSQVSPRDVEDLRRFARTIPARRTLWRRPAIQFALAAVAVALIAVVTLPLVVRLPGVGTQSPAPTSPAPTTSAPAPSPTRAVTPLPSVGVGTVRLLTASGSTIDVAISDPDGLLTAAQAEQAKATMSVRWFDSIVESAGPNAIRVTWVGYPRDEQVQLAVSKSGSKLVLAFVQQAPPPLSDAQGEDRVLVLELAAPVDPSNVEVTFNR